MFKLVSKTDVMPRSLFITDIEKDPQAIAVGGFGKVFMGKCGEQLVAMKMLFRGHHAGVRGFTLMSPIPNANLLAKDSIEKNICKEALAWRSLSHRFILPLLGIYEEGPQLFLVSPFMTNGALRDWRRQLTPVRIDEIERLVRC
jgi:serine/threonine protein kinase